MKKRTKRKSRSPSVEIVKVLTPKVRLPNKKELMKIKKEYGKGAITMRKGIVHVGRYAIV